MGYDDQATGALTTGGLVGVNGACAGYNCVLNPGEEVIIGKDSKVCSVVIDPSYQEVSRKHVSVTYDMVRGQYRVVDFSSNGTWANGRKLVPGQENYFPAGTIIDLANKKNTFKLGGVTQTMQTPPPRPNPQPATPPPMSPPPVEPQPMTPPPMNSQPMNQQMGYQEQQSGGKGLAIASMVLGIVTMVIFCVPYVPFVTALIAVILGGVSLGKKKPGKGMAIAGLVCGIIGLVPNVIILISGASLLGSLGMFGM